MITKNCKLPKKLINKKNPRQNSIKKENHFISKKSGIIESELLSNENGVNDSLDYPKKSKVHFSTNIENPNYIHSADLFEKNKRQKETNNQKQENKAFNFETPKKIESDRFNEIRKGQNKKDDKSEEGLLKSGFNWMTQKKELNTDYFWANLNDFEELKLINTNNKKCEDLQKKNLKNCSFYKDYKQENLPKMDIYFNESLVTENKIKKSMLKDKSDFKNMENEGKPVPDLKKTQVLESEIFDIKKFAKIRNKKDTIKQNVPINFNKTGVCPHGVKEKRNGQMIKRNEAFY